MYTFILIKTDRGLLIHTGGMTGIADDIAEGVLPNVWPLADRILLRARRQRCAPTSHFAYQHTMQFCT